MAASGGSAGSHDGGHDGRRGREVRRAAAGPASGRGAGARRRALAARGRLLVAAARVRAAPLRAPTGSAATAVVRRMAARASSSAQRRPGVVVVLRHGARVQVAHRGRWRTPRPVPRCRSGRRFHVASLTKPVVAAVVMRLVRAGGCPRRHRGGAGCRGSSPAGDRITVGRPARPHQRAPGLHPRPGRVAGAGPAPGRPARARGRGRPGAAAVRAGAGAGVLQHQLRRCSGLVVERVTGRPLEDRPGAARSSVPLGMRSASLCGVRVDEPPVAHGYVLRDRRHGLGPHLGVGRRRPGDATRPTSTGSSRALFAGDLLSPPARRRDGRAGGRVRWGRGPATGSAWPGCPRPAARRWGTPASSTATCRRRTRSRTRRVRRRADGEHRPGPPRRAAPRRARDRAVRERVSPWTWRIRQSGRATEQ